MRDDDDYPGIIKFLIWIGFAAACWSVVATVWVVLS